MFSFADELQSLPSGTHDYSFSCTLPRDLPSSFLGSHGHIKYNAIVVLRIPLWPDEKFEEKFDVLRPFDLNDHPSLRVNFHAHTSPNATKWISQFQKRFVLF